MCIRDSNDTVPTRGWLTAMAKHLQNDSHLGMCGPVTNSIGNEAKVAVEYHDLDGLEPVSYTHLDHHHCGCFDEAGRGS